MILFLTTACLGAMGLSGEETDGYAPPDSATYGEPVEVSRWFASGTPDAVGEPHALTLSDDGSLGISVEHFGYEAPCTAAVDADASVSDGTITVVYTYQAPDTYADTCAWTLSYALSSGAGDWVVAADGDEATVSVAGGG